MTVAALAADSAFVSGGSGAEDASDKKAASSALITAAAGGLPIILSAPHGGRAAIPGVPERQGAGASRFNPRSDSNTDLLTEKLADALERKLGKRPYVVIARFHRKYIDANRRPGEAFEAAEAQATYDAYHAAIAAACKDVTARWGSGVVLDIHGQATKPGVVFRGTQNGKTVSHLVSRSGREAAIGETSLFGQLAKQGFTVFPPVGSSDAETTNYTGGYIVGTYGSGSGGTIDAMQLEFAPEHRASKAIADVSGKLANAITAFARSYLPAEEPKPNILVILADDLGYGDVHCYNPQRGKIPTPNIDRLAAQGVRFTDAHSSSGICSPSRYALLTGRYHWRTRLQRGIVGVFGEPLIAPDRMTIGTLAKQHGYSTAAIGKWHLGWDWPIPENKRKLFTELDGKSGGANQKGDTTLTDAHRAAWREVFSQPIPGGPTTRGFDEYFGTDVPNWPPYCFIENNRTLGIPSERLSAEKLKKYQASRQGPALPGWTLEPILPALGDRACDFITRHAKAKKPFLLYLPLTTPHTPLAVNEAWRGKSGLDNAAADLIMETDDVVGRVLNTLDESGVASQTFVLFTSDNGFAPYVGAADLEKRGHYPSGPLRGYKFDVWEGGHRVAFMARWPGVVKPGSVCNQLVHQTDILRTLADILGTELPDNAGEDSFSLLPLLKGDDKPVRPHAVSCAGAGTPGVRKGDWKFIPGKEPGLYNLAEDIGETKNLANDKHELVAEMNALLEQLIIDGRSTPGAKQKNDVEVSRYSDNASAPKAKGK